MQCPTCGYEGIFEEACFCPQCRHPFRDPEDEVIFESSPPHVPQPREARRPAPEALTGKEIRKLEVQLLQPAILLMLSIAVVLYIATGRIQELTTTVLSVEIRYGGLLCLLIGAIIAWIFYRIALYRITSR